jgi:hypothetical protein
LLIAPLVVLIGCSARRWFLGPDRLRKADQDQSQQAAPEDCGNASTRTAQPRPRSLSRRHWVLQGKPRFDRTDHSRSTGASSNDNSSINCGPRPEANKVSPFKGRLP